MERVTICLDTTILIDYFRKKNKERTAFYHLSLEYNFAISTATEYEYLVGFKDKNRQGAKDIFKNLSIIPFDSKLVKEACEIYHELININKLISPLDIFIAATARSNDLELATINIKHFKWIKKLKLIELEKYK
ncbi:MAG: type II toxin-antitoxin system VapC family toxin [Bacteroidetes bacterium]|nr:type II toxin-antitoxin system VapC family toxin [Bacteroidota bacterium]